MAIREERYFNKLELLDYGVDPSTTLKAGSNNIGTTS